MKTKKLLHSCIGIVAAATLAAPAYAQNVFPPFEVGDDLQFRPETRSDDLALQMGLLLPRAPALMQSTQQTARAGLAGWRERNADLRDLRGERGDGGVWVSVIGQYGERTRNVDHLSAGLDALPADFDFALLETRFETLIEDWAEDLDYDEGLDPAELQARIDATIDAGLAAGGNLSYEQDIHGFNVGFDFIHGGDADRAWVSGLNVGYLRSSTEFDDFSAWGAGSKFDSDTVNVGAYGSLVAGSWYLDAALSYAWHELDMQMPMMFLRPDGAVLSMDGRTLSASLDSGWRLSLADERYYIEPLAGLVWVRADIDDSNVQPGDAYTHGISGSALTFGRQESLRGNVGLRFGSQWTLGGFRLSGDIGLRSWREFERETTAALGLRGQLRDLADPASVDVATTWRLPTVEDRMPGSYTDIAVSAGLQTADGHLVWGLNLGRTSASGYENHTISATFRYQW